MPKDTLVAAIVFFGLAIAFVAIGVRDIRNGTTTFPSPHSRKSIARVTLPTDFWVCVTLWFVWAAAFLFFAFRLLAA
ncbi:hypothetical protein [Lysobacter rhizosphaerae]